MLLGVPKRVDHDEHRRQIADALWRVVGTSGFDAVSLRRVAAEAELPDPPLPREAVRALLVQMLPLDEQRNGEGHFLFAFLAEGVREGPIGERMRTGMAQLREFVTTQAAAGVVPDPRRAATVLLALTDGLAAHVLGGCLSREDALTALDAYLDDLFASSSADLRPCARSASIQPTSERPG